jgi:glycerol-3-phosphate dehydrogenase (NAD(P)+)
MEMKKYYKKRQHICIASKGIEQGSCLFIASIIKKNIHTNKLCVISGGTFAVDMIKKVPLGLTLACKNKSTINIIKKSLQNNYLRLSVSSDIFGVEMYGAIKNVIAIASGILLGLGYKDNSRAALITRGLAEITRYGVAIGASQKTFLGLTGIGDLFLTCSSLTSRNFSSGVEIGRLDSAREFLKNNTKTVEGIYACKIIHDAAIELGVDMPITNAVYNVLYLDKKPSEELSLLMTRRLRQE